MKNNRVTYLSAKRPNIDRLPPEYALEDTFCGRIRWGDVAGWGRACVWPRPHRCRP